MSANCWTAACILRSYPVWGPYCGVAGDGGCRSLARFLQQVLGGEFIDEVCRAAVVHTGKCKHPAEAMVMARQGPEQLIGDSGGVEGVAHLVDGTIKLS